MKTSIQAAVLILVFSCSQSLIASIIKPLTVDCDSPGAADYDSIGSAVQAVTSGGVIHIAAGTCTEGEMDISSNVTIIGEGDATVILPDAETGANTLFKVFSRTNVRIKNIKIDPGSSYPFNARNTNNLTITGVRVSHAFGNGILIDGGENIIIEKNIIDNSSNHGIALSEFDLDYPKFVSIRDNIINNSGQSCINVSNSRQVFITGNKVKNCGNINAGYGGVRVTNHSEQISINGNHITQAARGIFLTTNSKNITISNNTIERTLIHGLLVQNASNVSVTGNIIRDDTGSDAGIRVAGTDLQGVVLTGNHLLNNNSWGIRIAGIQNSANILIVGNLLSCNGSGGLSLPTDSTVKAESNYTVMNCN